MPRIDDPAGLSEALNLVHGLWFASDDVLYDPETRSLAVSLARRADEEPPEVVRNLGWLYRRWRVPLRETLLRIGRVTDHTIEPGGWRLEGIGYHGGDVSILALERPVIRASVEALDLEVDPTPNLTGERIESCTLGFLRRYEIRRDGSP